jgi:hypothetical protein
MLLFFFKLFSQLVFFNVRLIGSTEVKTLNYSHFSFIIQLYRVKYLKCLRTRKYSLDHKCKCNLSLGWLFLANVTFYLKCLERVVLAHPFWALATFPVCYSVLSCWTNRAAFMGIKWSSWIWKKHTVCKKAIYVPNDDYFVSVGLQWTNRKIIQLLFQQNAHVFYY